MSIDPQPGRALAVLAILLALAAQDAHGACPTDAACPVVAGEPAPAAGWWVPGHDFDLARAAYADLDAALDAIDQCRGRERATLARLDACGAQLAAVAPALRPATQPLAPQDADAPSALPAWLGVGAGALCVGAGWYLADGRDLGVPLGASIGGACAVGVGLLAWRW